MTRNPTQPGPPAPDRSGQVPAQPDRPGPQPDRPGQQPASAMAVTTATAGYLGVIVLGPIIPLAIYAVCARRSAFLRQHAASAVNLSVTCVLYALCCAIVGGLLALDTMVLGLVIAILLGLALWLTMLWYLIRGIGAAKRGEQEEVPSWLSVTVVS